MDENTRKALSVGMAHKINAIAKQDLDKKEMPEGLALFLGTILIVLIALTIVYVVTA